MKFALFPLRIYGVKETSRNIQNVKSCSVDWGCSGSCQSGKSTVASPLTPTSAFPSLPPVGHQVILLHPAEGMRWTKSVIQRAQDCFHPQTSTCNTCLHQQPLGGPRQWPQVILVTRAHREELLAPAGKPPASETEGEARNGVVGKGSHASEPAPLCPPPWPARPKPPHGQEHSRPGGPSYQCG